MADFKFTSRDKQEVYRLIILLNDYLQFIVLRLVELAKAKILSPKRLKEMRDLTEKVKTEKGALLEPKAK